MDGRTDERSGGAIILVIAVARLVQLEMNRGTVVGNSLATLAIKL